MGHPDRVAPPTPPTPAAARRIRSKDDRVKSVTPCWPIGQACPNACARRTIEHLVHNHVDLVGPWTGWHLAGKDLVSPDGERISPERMKGLLWRIQAETRVAKARNRRQAQKQVSRMPVRVIVVDNHDWHARHFGTHAG